jgi:hypothetical protein
MWKQALIIHFVGNIIWNFVGVQFVKSCRRAARASLRNLVSKRLAGMIWNYNMFIKGNDIVALLAFRADDECLGFFPFSNVSFNFDC